MNNIEKTIFELNILVGLPGSGKTYFAETNYNREEFLREGKFIIDVEKYKDQSLEKAVNMACDNSDMPNYCGPWFSYAPNNVIHACIDGLFITRDTIKNLIIYLVNYINNYTASRHILTDEYTIHINVHQWDKNIEACLHNDALRVKYGHRNQSAEVTIKNAQFDVIINKTEIKYFTNGISNISNIKLINHKVKYANYYDVMFRPLIEKDRNTHYGGHICNYDSPHKTKYMYSDEWSGGGNWGNCWGGHGSISSDSPLNFDKFDKLIEKICPKMSFIDYKNIYNQCVDTEETYEHDYYGGCETKIRWRCDLEKLYEMLKSLNLINANN